MTKPWQATAQGLSVRVHVQPRAARNQIVGLHGDAFKIALTAPPVGGAANAALLTFLATTLRLPRTAVSLQAGEKSREKRVLIKTAAPEQMILQFETLAGRVDKKKGDD